MTKINLSGPDITDLEIEQVVNVLQTRHLSLGPKLPEFETKVAEYVGSRYAIAVNSGTSGLHLLVRALGFGPGDRVITSPFSFIASAAEPIVKAGPDSAEDIIQSLAENLNRQNITAVMRLYSPDYRDDAGNTHETLSAYCVANIDRFEGVNLRVLEKSDTGGIMTAKVRYAFPMDPAFVVRMSFEKRTAGLLIRGSEFVRMEE